MGVWEVDAQPALQGRPAHPDVKELAVVHFGQGHMWSGFLGVFPLGAAGLSSESLEMDF